MDIPDLIAELNNLANKIRAVDHKSANRLVQLADMIEQSDYGKQAAMDLYGAFDPKGIEESAFEVYRRRPWWFSVVEWVRNVLVLAPICLTWYGLCEASVNYERLISKESSLITQPFLLLWEQGFTELGSDVVGLGLKFSQVALWDFYLLLVVLTFTVVVHFFRDVLEAKVARDALILRQNLEDVLWKVSKLLVEERYRQNQGTAIAQFEDSAKELVKHLKEERTRLAKLAKQREKEFGDLSVLSRDLATGAEKLERFSKNVQGIYDPLQGAVEKLAGHVEATGEQHEQLAGTIEKLNGQMSELVNSLIQAERSLHSVADELGSSADHISAYTGMSTANFQDVCELLDDMSKRIDVITHNLREATGNAGHFSRLVNETMISLNQVGQALIPALQDFSQETTQLTNRLIRAISSLERSVGRGRPSRPLMEWAVIIFVTIIVTGVFLMTTAQAFGLFR